MRTSRSYLVSILSFLLIIFIISNISSDIHKNENCFHVNDDIIATSLKIHDRNPRSAIHYTVVDRYASGEKVIREVRNSLEYSPTSRIDQNGASQPLSSYKTNLLGSDEIGILTRNPTNSFTGASTIGRYSDHVNLDYNSSTPIGTLSQIGKGGSVVGPVIEGQLAAGDLDGNFREEIVFAGILNSELNIKIGENWGDYGFGVRAHTTNTHLWPTSQVLTVTTGDYDGDTIDEFAVLGLSGTQPNIWVFEDLINSTPNQEQYLYYGDVVVFRSVNGPDRYVYSTGTATGVLDGKDVPEINAPTDTTIQFVLEDPENRNSTDLIQFGDNVLIRDFKGNYWTDHNMSGFAETWPMPQIIGQPPVVTDQQRWILHSDRPGNPAVGALTPNCYVSFQNNFTGRFIRAYAQYEMVSDNTYPADWFRVFNNNTLPRTFTQIGLKPIATLTNTNFQKLDILPSSWEHDIGKLIATKGMVSGNIDNDMMEELIVIGMDTLGWARAWIYDDALTDFTLLHEISWVNSIQNIHPNVALTNLDDDKPFEIVFSFSKSTFGKLEIYDDQTNGFSRLQEITSSGNSLYGELTNLATGDIDADGYDEIVFVNGDSELYVWDYTSGGYSMKNSWNAGTGLIPHYTRTTDLAEVNYYFPLDLAIGDVDRDGQEEIIFSSMISYSLYYYQGSGGLVSIWDYNGTSFELAFCEGPFHFEANTNNYGTVAHAQTRKLAIGDFCADHFTVKYLDHDMYTTNEQIIAVMAAPPTQHGISQNYDDSGTSYGEGQSSSSGQSWGASASFGAYMSLEIEVTAGFLVSLKISKIEAEFALISETSLTHTVTYTTAYVSSFSTDAYSDYVIFSTCLYDMFIYEIVDAPDPLLIGENYTLHIPVDPTVEKWDVEFYNEHNSEYAHDIGRETFNHTIGYVTSYPSQKEMQQIAPNGTRLETNKISVGKGGATIGQEIDLSTETSIDLEISLKFEWKAGAGGGVVTAGLQGSLGMMGGHSWGWGEDTMFACEIGDIEDDEDYINFRYQCGLFVYVENFVPKATKNFLSEISSDLAYLFEQATTLGLDSFNRGEGYYVLNYWVEVPDGWGGGAADARDYAEDMDDIIAELIQQGGISAIIFYPVIAMVPAVNLFIRKKGGKIK